MKRIVISAGQEILFKKHTHPEGVLTHGIAAFDSPNCGMRIRADPDLDTARTQTIATTILGGGYTPNNILWATISPTTLSGLYSINLVRALPWLNFIEFFMFNTDTVDHAFITGGYILAVLTEERPEPADKAILRLLKEKKGMDG